MIHRQDNTFVITKSGYPYHVTADMPEYAGLLAEYADNPVAFTEEYPPVIPEPTPAEIAQAEIDRLESLQTKRLTREAITDTLAGLTTSFSINKMAEIDAAIAVQRAILSGE